mmetsp:Transcript_21495/g.64364  ORF Transcript_21495/g.64364 Transcript_21495/m.64364 type:complete len:260 (+) Transcript_21495:110-889(+)
MAAVVSAAPTPAEATAAPARRERISDARALDGFFATYGRDDASTAELVAALRERLDRRINGSVLANMDAAGEVYVSFSEKDRSAPASFWREVAEPLKAFLKSAPALARRDLGRTMGDEGGSYMFQVQWLTGRKANYWHQDVRWKQHWDCVFFLYAGAAPTPTDLACPADEDQPGTLVTPKEYVRCPDGQPDIAAAARAGDAVTYRPAVALGDVVCVDNRRVWHRTPESLTLAAADDVAADDALMTVRLKHFPPRPADAR